MVSRYELPRQVHLGGTEYWAARLVVAGISAVLALRQRWLPAGLDLGLARASREAMASRAPIQP